MDIDPLLRALRRPALLLGVCALAFTVACGKKSDKSNASTQASDAKSEPPQQQGEKKPASRPPLSSIRVNHAEFDVHPPEGAPELASTTIAATIYKLPNDQARRLGYVRLGQKVPRDPAPVPGKGCAKGKWYRIYPIGFMCTEEATEDLDSPLVRAASLGPELDKPLPYRYGFVRATAPQYLRIPTKAEQIKSEFGLEEHIIWFNTHKADVQTVVLGANDVALDERGVPVAELFGSESADQGIPFWLVDGGRSIPNVADFKVPEYSIFADRVRRHTGLSFVGSFDSTSDDLTRRFAITVDLRLIPTTKVKPDTGSAFHGLEIPEKMHFPFAFITKKDTSLYKLLTGRDASRPAEAAPHRAIVPLSGKARIKEGQRFYQTLGNKQRWLKDSDIGVVHKPAQWPEPAEKNEKWIDISLGQQTLTLYDGKIPRYATLISGGRDRFGDPKKDLTTPLGDFRLQSKHIAAAMDSQENSTVSGGQKSRKEGMDAEGQATTLRLKKMNAAGTSMNEEDKRRWINVQKGRHPEYGVTKRRGSTNFELRDVPWIQYFSAGFALHGAYWHDVFGVPRSHGCVNLSPIDARVVFNWTDPPVPPGWHGVNIGDDMGLGTWVHIRK
jgi:hypothetical protein